MQPAHRAYLARETAASALINAVISLLVAWLVFGRAGSPVTDAQAFGADFLPQAFILSVMSSLVPTALTRRRLHQGVVAPAARLPLPLPRNQLLRALLIGLVAMVVAGGVAALLTPAVWTGPLSMPAVYAVKVVFGVLLSIPVTLLAVRAALADGTT